MSSSITRQIIKDHKTAQPHPRRKECVDTLNRIWRENRGLKPLEYFLDTVYHRSCGNLSQIRPAVVILGTEVPEELVYAAGAVPFWILGGSPASMVWSEDLVPRDADPVSRSMLGYLHQLDGPDYDEALFIVPVTCDNMRKIAFALKKEGKKLFVLDVPPDREDRRAAERWQRQVMEMTAVVAAHMGTRVTRRTVASARKQVGTARRMLSAFLRLTGADPRLMTPSAVLLVRNSYYCTDSVETWTFRLALLIRALKEKMQEQEPRPGVLLMGSPVIFPNYKVPFLIEEAGLDIVAAEDASTLKNRQFAERELLWGSRDAMIRAIAEERYRADGSSSYVRNEALQEKVRELLRTGRIEGVIYHVLKGQVETDFERESMEELFAQFCIPVFRLETDYFPQDVEQLRIRLEAFSEMLGQTRRRRLQNEVRKAQ